MAHVNFVPNEYEQMLIAAGWVTAESLDTEYQEYLRSTVWLQRQFDEFEPATYAGWKSMREQWNCLDEAYKADVQPYYDSKPDGNIPWNVRERESNLLREMDWLETCLGY